MFNRGTIAFTGQREAQNASLNFNRFRIGLQNAAEYLRFKTRA
jgi:hypothetical protein